MKSQICKYMSHIHGTMLHNYMSCSDAIRIYMYISTLSPRFKNTLPAMLFAEPFGHSMRSAETRTHGCIRKTAKLRLEKCGMDTLPGM